MRGLHACAAWGRVGSESGRARTRANTGAQLAA